MKASHRSSVRLAAPILASLLVAAAGARAQDRGTAERVSHPDRIPSALDVKYSAELSVPSERAVRLPTNSLHPIDHSRMECTTARGEQDKASFDARDVTYSPMLGQRQPHHVPHCLSPDRVTIGDAFVLLEHDVATARVGDRVEIDRDGFVGT